MLVLLSLHLVKVMFVSVDVSTLIAVPPPISIVKVRGLGPPLPTDVIIGDPVGPVGVTVFCGPSFFTVEDMTVTLIEAHLL